MSNEFASKELPPEGRPGFLSVLCVLIFVFAGWSLISNLMDAISPPDPYVMEQQIDDAMDRFAAFGGGDGSDDTVAHVKEVTLQLVEEARPIAILKALAAALAIYGAFMMWRLKRTGFHLYVIAGIVWAFAPMLFVGASMITWIYAVMYGFIVLLFTIMFAVNLRYMEKE